MLNEELYNIGTATAFILFGYIIRVYLKKAKIDNLNKVLGLGVYWLKFISYVFIIFGFISLVFFCISLYYYLRLNDII